LACGRDSMKGMRFRGTKWTIETPTPTMPLWLPCINATLLLSLAVLLAGCGGGGSRGNSIVTPPPASPTVSNVSPSSGPRSGGTRVTITGTGFAFGATASVGGSVCTSPVFVSGTQLTCTTGGGTAGHVDVVVTNPGGSSGVLTSGFTYL